VRQHTSESQRILDRRCDAAQVHQQIGEGNMTNELYTLVITKHFVQGSQTQTLGYYTSYSLAEEALYIFLEKGLKNLLQEVGQIDLGNVVDDEYLPPQYIKETFLTFKTQLSRLLETQEITSLTSAQKALQKITTFGNLLEDYFAYGHFYDFFSLEAEKFLTFVFWCESYTVRPGIFSIENVQLNEQVVL
jgi:hypothetical protein